MANTKALGVWLEPCVGYTSPTPLGPRALTGAHGRQVCTGNAPTGSRSGRCRSRRTRTRSPRRKCHCCTWSRTSERENGASAEMKAKEPKAHSALRGGHGGGAEVYSGTGCSPVADPARVAACALASDVIAGVPITTRRAAVAAALAVETSGARLVTLRAVPAGLTGQAAAFRHGTWLLALALAASGEEAGG